MTINPDYSSKEGTGVRNVEEDLIRNGWVKGPNGYRPPVPASPDSNAADKGNNANKNPDASSEDNGLARPQLFAVEDHGQVSSKTAGGSDQDAAKQGKPKGIREDLLRTGLWKADSNGNLTPATEALEFIDTKELNRLSKLEEAYDQARKRFLDSLSQETRNAYQDLKGTEREKFEARLSPTLSNDQRHLLNEVNDARKVMIAGIKASPFYDESSQKPAASVSGSAGTPIPEVPPASSEKAKEEAVTLTNQQRQAYLYALGYKNTANMDGPVAKSALKEFAEEARISTENGFDMAKIDQALQSRIAGTKAAQNFIEESQERIKRGIDTGDDIKALQWVLKGNGAGMPISLEKNGTEMDGIAKSETKAAITDVLTRINASKNQRSAAEPVKAAAAPAVASDAPPAEQQSVRAAPAAADPVTTLPTITVSAEAEPEQQAAPPVAPAPQPVQQPVVQAARPPRGGYTIIVNPGTPARDAANTMQWYQQGGHLQGGHPRGQAGDMNVVANYTTSRVPGGPYLPNGRSLQTGHNMYNPVADAHSSYNPVRQVMGTVQSMGTAGLRSVSDGGGFLGGLARSVAPLWDGMNRKAVYDYQTRAMYGYPVGPQGAVMVGGDPDAQITYPAGQFNAASRVYDIRMRNSDIMMTRAQNQAVYHAGMEVVRHLPGHNHQGGLFGQGMSNLSKMLGF
jgi:hypothetical protein